MKPAVELLLELRQNGFTASRVVVGGAGDVTLDGVVDLRAEVPRRPAGKREHRVGVDGLMREYGGSAYEQMLAAAAGQEPRNPDAPGDIALVREED